MKKIFKKIISVVVAATMIFSTLNVSLILSAETETQISTISKYLTINDYDFTGDVVSYYHTGDLTTYMYCCAEKNDGNGANNNRWYPSVARYLGSKVEVITNGGIDNSACAKIHQARPVEAPYPAYIKIYDSHTYSTGIKTFENIKVMYEPLKNTRFKITFKYKRMAELTTDVTLSMRASTNVNTSESAKDHDRLGDFYTISAGNPDSDWQTAEGYFSVGDKDYKELFIIFSHAGSNNISTNIYIDDVQVDIARDININNFDDALNITNPIKYKDEGGYATWMARPDYADKDVDWNQWHFRLLSLNFVIEDGNGVEDSYGARIRTIKTEPSAYLKLYDDREDLSAVLPNAMFKPKQNTKYKMTFKYRVAKIHDTDVVFSVLGDTTSNDGPTLANLDELGTVFTLPANTAVSDEWKTAEGYFTTGSTAYKELDLIVTSSKEYVKYDGLYIDDIAIEEVGAKLNTNDGDCYYLYGDTYEDIRICSPLGVKFDGWYKDSNFTTKATGYIEIDDQTVYAKWSAPDTIDFADNSCENVLDLSWLRENYELTDDGTLKINMQTQGTNTWPRQIQFKDASGNNAETVPGHTYKFTCSLKSSYRNDRGEKHSIYQSLYLANYRGQVKEWKNGIYTDENGKEAIVNLSYFTAGTDWIDIELIFTEGDSACPLSMVLYEIPAGVEIDNLQIVDITALGETISTIENDVNRDGAFDARDLVRLKKIVVKVNNVNLFADIYKEENVISIDASDLAAVRKLLLGMDVEDNTDLSKLEYYKSNVAGESRSLVWHDEFYANSLNKNVWSILQERYVDDEEYNLTIDDSLIKFEDGALKMVAKSGENGSTNVVGQITSKTGLSFKYGYLEMRAKLPFGVQGPGFWMTSNTPKDGNTYIGEIDIFEVMGDSSGVTFNLHKWEGGNNGGHVAYGAVNLDKPWARGLNDGEYHTYGFEWSETEVKFYVDGEVYGIVDISNDSEWAAATDGDKLSGVSPFHNAMEILISAPVETKDGEPTEMYVDYIRLYQNTQTDKLYK